MYTIEMAPIGALSCNLRNAKTHPNKQIQQLVDAYKRFRWMAPLLADEHGMLIAGEGRLKAAQKLRLREVPIIRIKGLSEAEKQALALADNKIASNSGWNREILATVLSEISDLAPKFDLSVEITGFEEAEADLLLSDFSNADVDPVEEIPEPLGNLVSTAGDVWQLGNHKILCGDARDADALRRLLGKLRASAAFLDPPYNLCVKRIVGRGDTKHSEFVMGSGEWSSAELIGFLKQALRVVAAVSCNGAVHYVCMDWRHFAELAVAGRDVYGSMLNTAVWVKSNAGQGSFYRSQHEFVGVFRVGDAPHRNNVQLGRYGHSRSNVWHYAGASGFRAGRMEDLRAHPTVKPVALIADAIKDCTKRGDTVLDTFSGSGTTLLAAERTGRRAAAVEIEPRYVDLAIRRWQTMTGRDAILIATGETFDERASKRSTPRIRRAR